MKSLGLYKDVVQIGTIQDLTAIFESIASLRISHIKNKVATSQAFFDELWGIYTQLRIDPRKRMAPAGEKRDKPNVYLLVTSEGGLSGDIDNRIVRQVLEDYDSTTTDLLVMGAHGATLLAQHRVTAKQVFRLPESDQDINVGPIIEELKGYSNPSVYYQKYISLAVQEVDRINLLSRVQDLGADGGNGELITTRDYLFEPSSDEVISYLEAIMLEIALGQVILESKLAQYASRFSAMSAAHKKAQEVESETNLKYHRAKRLEGDERLKEVINAMNLV